MQLNDSETRIDYFNLWSMLVKNIKFAEDHLRNIHTEFVFTLFNSFSEKDKTERRTDNGNQVKVMKIAPNGPLVMSANQKDCTCI